MLEDIAIRGLGVIEDAVLPLGNGFTAITGETGAGKTMVVTALGLLLGGRATAGAVRAQASRAVVDGHVRLTAEHPASRVAEELGAEVELDTDGTHTLILSRQVQDNGRSRAWLGGRPVPAGKLAEIGELLVAVHGQSDQLRLTQEHTQRDALDRFGAEAAAAAVDRVASQFDRVQQLRETLNALEQSQSQRAERRAALRELADSVADAAPEVGEDASLLARIERLSNRESLRQDIGDAHRTLTDDTSGASLRDGARSIRQLIERALRMDASLEVLHEAANDLEYTIDDLAAQLASYLADLDLDGIGELEVLNDRLALLEDLKRKFDASSLDELLERAEHAERELLDLEGDETRIPQMRIELETESAALAEAANALSQLRQELATELSALVDRELHALAMPDAKFSVVIERLDQVRRHGHDRIQFMLVPHPGSVPAPIGVGASGGELSRIMLALEVVLAAANPVPTLVFDEIDAGVGGAAALEIGARLQRLATTSQVIVVTHLAQVAAFADHHVEIAKTTDGEVTSSAITELDASGRVAELTRLLSGLTDSESGAAHAKELLEIGKSHRKKSPLLR